MAKYVNILAKNVIVSQCAAIAARRNLAKRELREKFRFQIELVAGILACKRTASINSKVY